MMVTTDEIVTILKSLELEVEVDHGPTEFRIATEQGDVLVARDFNWSGWEAVLEYRNGHGEQVPLTDGPTNAASKAWVVLWLLKLAIDPRSNFA